jgi:hypothetical protein
VIEYIAHNLEDIAKYFDIMAERYKGRSDTESRVYKCKELLARSETYADCAKFLREVKFESGTNADEN